MHKLVIRNQQYVVKIEKEFHQLIDALSTELAELTKRVAALDDVGDDVPAKRVRQARIPPKPEIMVAAGAGSGAKGG